MRKHWWLGGLCLVACAIPLCVECADLYRKSVAKRRALNLQESQGPTRPQEELPEEAPFVAGTMSPVPGPFQYEPEIEGVSETGPRVARTHADFVAERGQFEEHEQAAGLRARVQTVGDIEIVEQTADEMLESLRQQNQNLEPDNQGALLSDFEQPAEDYNPFEETAVEQAHFVESTPPGRRTASLNPRTSRMADTAPRAAAGLQLLSATRETSTRTTPIRQTGSPQVGVKWVTRGEVNLGLECRCDLVVKNSGTMSAEEVVVSAQIPRSVKLVDASPLPTQPMPDLEWTLGSLAAGETRTIELRIIPTQPGDLATAARVRFTETASTSLRVSEPQLKLEVQAPKSVQVGDPATTLLTVSNPGTGTAADVVIQSELPAGLEAAAGRTLTAKIGPLGPGQSRTVRLPLLASAGGLQVVRFTAHSAASQVTAEAVAKLQVLAPTLAIEPTGPSLRYVNRTAKYVVKVTNTSRAPCDNVRLAELIPNGFEYVGATPTATWNETQRTVTWFLGRLGGGETVSVELQVEARELGEYQHEFLVAGDGGAQATASVATRVDGAASLIMEIRDLDDPVEIGASSAYEIVIRNEGTRAARQVGLICELPAGTEMINVEGPTVPQRHPQGLAFKPLTELPPGESAVYRVHYRGTAAGLTRLRAKLSSEALPQPLLVEETTRIYGE